MQPYSRPCNRARSRTFLHARAGVLSALLLVILVLGVACAGTAPAPAPYPDSDPLPSWNDGAAKEAIFEFVRKATDESGPGYVAPDDRVAVFDQDGTLWVEHPLYTQGVFALDRIRALAPSHPEWSGKEPYKSVIANDAQTIANFTKADWAAIIAATHAGMTTEQFAETVRQWLATAKHPRYDRPYTDLVYRPMLEVIALLRENGFRTFMVTGGGQLFVRTYAREVYGFSPAEIVGSSLVLSYEYGAGGGPVLVREPRLFLMDDGPGKAVGIETFIGQRPAAAFGNSDGDREMLEWTGAGNGARLMMLVLHDDPGREYAYGPAEGLPNTDVGTFPESLANEADAKGWVIISMKNDWNRIFNFEDAQQ
ncbi:MAG: haloacid dehalogenase-like hydrolase [Candidatus Dadabacteria bacterium]|nr:haloacid dehalogenase-like hydrolase [Candidatus Dadabacteria bacterium]